MNTVRPASGLPVKRMMGWLAIPVLIAPALMASPAALADELQDYVRQCDDAIGKSATVQDFDCDCGTEVPGNVPNSSGNCDEPNRLNKLCDPGSRFQVLPSPDDAYVVAHCRKKGNVIDDRAGTDKCHLAEGKYGDIAVIQYSRKNGATCFYQALGPGLPGHVKAPSNGIANTIWKNPAETAGIGCGGCHDNGPFIRSPYLNQVEGPNAIPGKDNTHFNLDELYAFVGQDFASWKAFTVEVGNECTTCHRLGVNNLSATPCGVTGTGGTALDFAERATSASEISDLAPCPAHKNPPSAASPMWMPPHQMLFDQAHYDHAKAIHDCAARFHVNEPLPSTNSCRITLLAEAYMPGPGPWPGPGQKQNLAPLFHLLLK